MAKDTSRSRSKKGVNAEEQFAGALAAAEASPDEDEHWDLLEDAAQTLQRPDEVGALYRKVLAEDISSELAAKLGQRAAQFHEEWFPEDSPHLANVLTRVLELDPTAEWALQRVTVLLTVGERWNELLSIYDKALSAATDEGRREQLLDEASHIAKDFAGAPDRAIGYLHQLLALRPTDAQLVASLERLLERQGRWQELIALWRKRVETATRKQALSLRQRIAACYLDHLDDGGACLTEVRSLLEDGGDAKACYALLERIVALPTAKADVRRGALDLLRERYEGEGLLADVIRVLGVALEFAQGDERIALHRELGARLAASGDARAAMEHWAAVLTLDPSSDDAQEQLAHLAQQANAHDRYAEALVAAADAAQPGPRQYALLVEAGDVRGATLGDREGAILLFQRVLGTEARAQTKLSVARKLEKLLDEAGRHQDRLAVLEWLGTLESDPVEKRRVLGQCALLADKLGDAERALGFWGKRLEEDPADLEALEASIQITEREARWAEHVEALRRRVEGPVPALQRRLDLARIAGTQAGRLGLIDDAVETWLRISQEFGEDHEVVDALFDLQIRAGRYGEIFEVLGRASSRDSVRAAEILARLGDVSREHLSRVDDAAKAYHRAILMVPELERAQRGLKELVVQPEAKASAVRGLAKAYELTGDWRALLDLLEHRLEGALDDAERVSLLREAAELHEQRAENLEYAFDAIRRALRFAPGNPELEAELLRLAEATGHWPDAAQSIDEAAASLADSRKDRAAQLRRREASIREERLSDPAGALTSLLAAQALEPHDVPTASEAIRVAAAAGKWDGAAIALVRVCKTRGALESELLEGLEGLAVNAGAVAQIAAGLAAAIPAPGEVPAALGRALEVKVAEWLRDRAGDEPAAEAALYRALAHEKGHTDTLRELARLQWKRPGQPLVDTLLELAGHYPDDLDPLHDAARIALENVGDVAQATSILDRLLRSARRLWEGTSKPTGERQADAMAIWAHGELVRIALEARDFARAVQLLVDGARMPVEASVSRDFRRRAGQLARTELGDEDRALRLFQSVVDESVEDAASVHELCGLLEGRNRLPELLALRQRQLEIKLDDETRLAVRLEVARVLGLIESQGGRIGVLRQNLRERPGHEASIERLAEILDATKASKELADLFTAQGAEVEQQGDAPRAANLWSRAARLLEESLKDIDGALKAHRRVVALQPQTIPSLDALARLHMDRGEPGTAAEWLKRRLDIASEAERGDIALKLADAYLAAGNTERTTQVLERVLAANPKMSDARSRLADLYREAEAYEPLARLLAEGAPHETDEGTQLAYVREAADLYENQLGQPDQAIPVLQMGIGLAPDDPDLKRKLALGLRVAGRLAEAREILEALAASYGRRRSPDRAGVHFQLAQVAHAAGDLHEAMEQLETARKMDMQHPGILRMAGRMAFEAGQLEQAEKAYRALLLVVRRQDPGASDVMVGASEVLYELSLLATAQKDEEQASELLETAVSTAATHDAEAERLVKDLLARKEVALALRVVGARLKNVEEPASEARMLAHKAEILAAHQGKHDEAFEALLKAVELAPAEKHLHEKARALAKQMSAVPRYVTTLRALVDKFRRKEEAPLAAELLLRLGEATEKELADLDGAAELYERVEKLGLRLVDAWRALARVADARGDSTEEVRVLEKLVEADDPQIPGEARTQALYRIAEVQLAAKKVEKGLATLRGALDRDPRYARAGAILQAAAADSPNDDSLLAVYEEVARASGDPAMVLDFIERRAARPDATLDHVREGVERADAIGAADRAEMLLARGVNIAQGFEMGLRDALWVPIGLSERRRAAGDIGGAIEWMRTAAESADGDEQTSLWMKVADLASQDGGDLRLAAETYKSLLANDPGNRNLWGPLAQVYAKLGDRRGLEDVVRTTLDALLDPADRNELRMHYATFLLDVARAPDDAVDVLKQVLEEDPDHLEAAQRLADLFEASGDHAALVGLLAQKLDRARDRQDIEAIVQLSLRMGKLTEAADRAGAMDHYRAGLDWAPQSRELLAALVGLYGDEHDPRERAELMERLLQVSSGPEAARIANDLIGLWMSLEDDFGAARALDFGFRACPSDASLRERLESYHRQRQEWAELAGVIAYDAERREDPAQAVGRYREAAFVWRETLGSPAKAAEQVRAAWARAPHELGLLEELVGDLSSASMHQEAAADVARALDHYAEPSAQRAQLLRLRARLELTLGSTEQAVADLEEAYSIAHEGGAADLIAGLDAKRMVAAHTGDLEAERDATHRLAKILAEAGDHQRSRDVLAEWVERAPNDREALRTLRDVDTTAERWPDVARHNARLVHVEEGAEQVQAALALIDASRKIQQPQYARQGLELVHAAQPGDASVQQALRSLYEEIGAHRELAQIVLAEAEHAADNDQKFELLRKAGELLVAVGDAEAALVPLAQAAALRPEDHELIIALSDAYMGSGRLQEAVELLQEAINGFKKRRSPALAAMQLRMARIAGISGDPETQKEWLNVALESDKNNGDIASELAELAIQLGDDETALKALRVVTLLKTPGPMTKAVAFLRQAQIAYKQGDQQKAVLWARRARLEDDALAEAQEFLQQIGEA